METPRFPDVLLVGGGAVAVEAHLPCLRGLPGNERVVLFEVDPERRRALRERFRDDRRLDLPDRLPEAGDFALAVLATPARHHLEGFQALQAMARRFLIEKPLARTVAEAADLAAAADRAGLPVAVHLPRGELGPPGLVAELHARRPYGPLRRVEVFDGRVFDWPVASAAAFSRQESGGGVLMDLGPHVLGQLGRVFRSLEVRGCTVDGDRDAVEANCTLDLVADGEVPVTAVMSRNRNLSGTARFEFAEAVATFGLMSPDLEVHPTSGPAFRARAVGDEGEIGFLTLVARFYRRRIVEGHLEGAGTAEALSALRLVEQAYQLSDGARMRKYIRMHGKHPGQP